MNRPWMQLHTRDWLDNKELRRCSPLARAILADLMCLAHEGNPYGHLADDVGPLTDKYMASRCVVTTGQFIKAIAELVKHRRLEKPEQGAMFIERMVEDENLRLSRAAGGSESRGNPKLGVSYNAPGFIYLLRRASDGAVKIGISTDVQNRIYKLKSQHKPDVLNIVRIFGVSDMGSSEAELHAKYNPKKVVGDWFSLDSSDISSIESSFESSFERKKQGKTPEVPRVRADAHSDSDSGSVSGFDSFSSDSHAVSFLGGSGGNGQSHNIANTAQEVGIPPPRRKPVVVPDTPVMRMCREWLEIYPNQVDVGRASQEWVSLVKDESHAREVLAGTKRYIESGAWRDSNGELVPNKAKNPMYFLRDGNYRDNPPPFKPRATNCRAVIDDSQLFPKVTPKPDWMRKAKPV